MNRHLIRDVKFWLNIATFVALAVLIVISREQIVEALQQLATLQIWVLALLIPAKLVSFYAIARLYKDFFDANNSRIDIKTAYKIALELNFVNSVFPSGGISGFSYLSLRLKRSGISTAKSTLAQILRFALTFLSFLLLLLVGVFLLALSHDTNGLVIFISSAIIFTTLFGTGVGIFIIGKATRIKAFVSWLPKGLNALFRLFRITKKHEIINMQRVESTLENMHEDYKALTRNIALVRRLFWWMLLFNVAEIITIYVVYVAFGTLINPGALILAYAIANFAGLIAILPGGVGVYEGLMTATLASVGVARGLALSATVLYRILSMLLFLPVGYYFYSKVLKSGGPDLKTIENESPRIDT